MSVSTTISAKQSWRIFAIASTIVLAYGPMLSKLGNDWWTDENYSHGLLVPFVIGFILWSQRQRFAAVSKSPAMATGLAFVLLGLMSLWAGTAGAELYLQRTSLLFLLSGTVIYFWGWNLLRRLIVPLFLLWLAIPIPAIIFNKVAFPLQLFASRCAVSAMSLFDIPVLRQGNVIELMPLGARETKKLEVVEACSGIRSLMTLLTLAVVYAYFTHPRKNSGNGGGGRRMFSSLKIFAFWRSAVILLSAVPIAIFTNALRVSGTGILARYYGTKVADGFFHTFSGWVIYIVAFLMLFGVGWLLDRGKLDKKQREEKWRQATALQTSLQVAEGTK